MKSYKMYNINIKIRNCIFKNKTHIYIWLQASGVASRRGM